MPQHNETDFNGAMTAEFEQTACPLSICIAHTGTIPSIWLTFVMAAVMFSTPKIGKIGKIR